MSFLSIYTGVQWHITSQHSAGPVSFRHTQSDVWRSKYSYHQVAERTVDQHCADRQSATRTALKLCIYTRQSSYSSGRRHVPMAWRVTDDVVSHGKYLDLCSLLCITVVFERVITISKTMQRQQKMEHGVWTVKKYTHLISGLLTLLWHRTV